jgi:hypothetical protein
MIPRRTAFFSQFLLLSALASGQASPAPTPADSKPPANPARPTVTNPATLTPVGYLQFEQGYQGALNSPETDTQHSLVQVTKLAVASRVMLQLAWQPFAHSDTEDGGPAISNDAGDILAGGEVMLYTPKESEEDAVAKAKDQHRHTYVKAATPTVTVGYLGRVYQGTAADIDVGSVSQSFIVLASGHAPFADVHYDVNLIANEQNDTALNIAGIPHNIRRAQFGQTFSVDRPLFSNQNLQFSAEIYHFSQPLVHATSSGVVVSHANVAAALFAISYEVQPNIVIDGGFSHGLTSTSTEWQCLAGLTYLLPHRLWPEHKK